MNFNIDPYNDDFALNAKDNNYLKILFKPGISVQARELTQIQSILQNQIKSFGDHVFQDGSPVIGGNLSLDTTVFSIKLDETYNNEDIELENYVGKLILSDPDNLVQAKVLAGTFEGGVPILLIKYLSGVEFEDADILRVAGTSTRAKLIDSGASGVGTVVSINEGIFYVDGYFITVLPQTIVVSSGSITPNSKIGLEVSDDVVDYLIDATLLDPAQASFNYQAPGADRYQFNLSLTTRPVGSVIDESKFFELMRLENGVITKQVKYPIYSEVEKTLARRTFDESGDYTVTPFKASIGESSNPDNYVINIEPGKAYVKGFEFETIGTFKVEAQKPRTPGIDTRSLIDIDFDTSYGNYLKFKNVLGQNTSFIDIKTLESIDVHCVDTPNVNVGLNATATSNVFFYGNTKIGTARVRNITRDSAALETSNVDSNGVFNFFFTEIDIKPKTFIASATSSNANSVVLSTYAAVTNDAYKNTTLTVLPISLTPIANVNTANIFAGSSRVNANSLIGNVFGGGNVAIKDIIKVGEETREVISIDSGGGHLFVNSAFTKTIDATNSTSDPLGVYKQVEYASNTTNQTRNIVRYDGTTKTAFLDRNFDESGIVTQNTVVQLNFSLKDLNSIVQVDTTKLKAGSSNSANVFADISSQSLLLNGDTELFEAESSSLIFPLPRSAVKRGSLDNVDYTYNKYFESVDGSVVGGANEFTFGVEAYESIPWSLTSSNIEDNLVVVVRASTASGVANGSVIKVTNGSSFYNVSMSGSNLLLKTPTTVTKVDAYVIVKVDSAQSGSRIRSKTLKSNTSLSLSTFNYPVPAGVTVDHTVGVLGSTVAQINTSSGLVFIDESLTKIYPGDSINLYVPDVIKVRKILKGNTTSYATEENYEDISDHFVIEHGQTEQIYDHAKIILKQGYPSPNSKVTVHLDFYDHSYPSGATFFSVDSYSNSIYENGEIPIFYSDSKGIFNLRDCLDFRPTRRIGLSNGTIDTGLLPNPDASTELSFDYYLPRIDKLVISKNREFRILKGISSPSPIPPDDGNDSMTLYTIHLPAFISSVGEIRTEYHENKRYTMRDIGKMEKRLQNIEYYTALNNVENRALNDPSKYEDGTDKAKYGIIGESFKTFNIADYKNPDFSVTMKEGEMGPYVNNKAYKLRIHSVEGTAKQNDRTISLNYTEVPAISQPLTSNKLVSVQPFLFAKFIGDLIITPETDFWVSEMIKPELLRNPMTQSTVREITNTERIVENFVQIGTTSTVPTPTTNAASLMSPSPSTQPPAGQTANTVPMNVANTTPVIPIGPVTSTINITRALSITPHRSPLMELRYLEAVLGPFDIAEVILPNGFRYPTAPDGTNLPLTQIPAYSQIVVAPRGSIRK